MLLTCREGLNLLRSSLEEFPVTATAVTSDFTVVPPKEYDGIPKFTVGSAGSAHLT
jgi:hypothetical protein